MIAGPVRFSVRHNPCHSHCQTPTICSLLVSTFSPELAEATTALMTHGTSMNRRVNMIDPPAGNNQAAERPRSAAAAALRVGEVRETRIAAALCCRASFGRDGCVWVRKTRYLGLQ